MQDKDKIREGHIENWLNIEKPVIKILLLPEIIGLEASGRGDKAWGTGAEIPQSAETL